MIHGLHRYSPVNMLFWRKKLIHDLIPVHGKKNYGEVDFHTLSIMQVRALGAQKVVSLIQ